LLRLPERCVQRRKIARLFKLHKRKQHWNCTKSGEFASDCFALLRSPSNDNASPRQRRSPCLTHVGGSLLPK
jgi:hypothetical protein